MSLQIKKWEDKMHDIMVIIAPGILIFEAVTDRGKIWMRQHCRDTLVQFDAVSQREEAKWVLQQALNQGLKLEQAVEYVATEVKSNS